MEKCFCVFLEGFLRIENWQRKQSYRKLKEKGKTHLKTENENWKRNIGCYSNASDGKHNLKIKAENKR